MKPQEIKNIDQVFVYKQDELAGLLRRTEKGSIFEYNPIYLEKYLGEPNRAVAYNIPLRKEGYHQEGVNLPPFFAGLLPEGLRLTVLVQTLKTSYDDLFSLLVATGADCIGDISVSIDSTAPPLHPKQTDVQGFDKVLFSELFQRSMGEITVGKQPLTTTIPGVQPKISASLLSFPVALKGKHQHYILKVGAPQFPQVIENEHFFMRLAATCGIKVANTTIVYDRKQNPGLLIERFDRLYNKKLYKITRIHQEDSCQFLDRYPADKYRLRTLQIAQKLENLCTAPLVDIARLIKLLVYSYIIANGDLHAKNISLSSDPESNRITLTPAYDLLSTLPYGDNQMALEFEGRKAKFKRKHFIEFGKRLGIREKVVNSIIEELTSKIESEVDRTKEINFDSKKSAYLKKTILTRVKEVMS